MNFKLQNIQSINYILTEIKIYKRNTKTSLTNFRGMQQFIRFTRSFLKIANAQEFRKQTLLALQSR